MQPDHAPIARRQRPRSGGFTLIRVALLGAILAAAVFGAARYLQPQPPLSRILARSPERFTALAFTPDNQRIAVADEGGKLTLHDVQSGRQVWSTKTGIVSTLSFSRDGRRLCDGKAVWIIPPGHRWLPVGVSSNDENLVLSPDGRRLAATDRRLQLHLYDLVNQKQIRIDTGYAKAFSPNGEMVAVGNLAADPGGHYTDYLWSIPESKCVLRLEGASFAGFSPDGKLFATQLGPTYRVRSIREGALMRDYHGNPTAFAFGPDSDRVAVVSLARIDLWRISTGQHEHRLRGTKGHVMIDRLAFSSDGRYLASAGGPRPKLGQKASFSVRLWRLDTLPQHPPARVSKSLLRGLGGVL